MLLLNAMCQLYLTVFDGQFSFSFCSREFLCLSATLFFTFVFLAKGAIDIPFRIFGIAEHHCSVKVASTNKSGLQSRQITNPYIFELQPMIIGYGYDFSALYRDGLHTF